MLIRGVRMGKGWMVIVGSGCDLLEKEVNYDNPFGYEWAIYTITTA